jgi:hypothetical protein
MLIYCVANQQVQETASSPMQTGHVGSSMDPTGGVDAISVDGVYCTEAINKTWHTSPCTVEQRSLDILPS